MSTGDSIGSWESGYESAVEAAVVVAGRRCFAVACRRLEAILLVLDEGEDILEDREAIRGTDERVAKVARLRVRARRAAIAKI